MRLSPPRRPASLTIPNEVVFFKHPVAFAFQVGKASPAIHGFE